jgi:hypothetical protein
MVAILSHFALLEQEGFDTGRINFITEAKRSNLGLHSSPHRDGVTRRDLADPESAHETRELMYIFDG